MQQVWFRGDESHEPDVPLLGASSGRGEPAGLPQDDTAAQVWFESLRLSQRRFICGNSGAAPPFLAAVIHLVLLLLRQRPTLRGAEEKRAHVCPLAQQVPCPSEG